MVKAPAGPAVDPFEDLQLLFTVYPPLFIVLAHIGRVPSHDACYFAHRTFYGMEFPVSVNFLHRNIDPWVLCPYEACIVFIDPCRASQGSVKLRL